MSDIADPDLAQSTGITNPLVLIRTAIDKGIDPDQLGKLLDLQERWEANRAREAFALAMNLAQQEMPSIIKDAENAHTKSRYAKLENVQAQLRPVYTKHGFNLSYTEEESKNAGHVRIVLDISHVGGHVKRIAGDFPLDGKGSQGGNSAMNAVQAKGSTISYGRRYLLLMGFNITVADEDTDGQGENAVIDGDQIGEINDLLRECKEAGNPVDFPRFLAWLGVQSLDQLPAKDFVKALHELNRKRRQKQNA